MLVVDRLNPVRSKVRRAMAVSPTPQFVDGLPAVTDGSEIHRAFADAVSMSQQITSTFTTSAATSGRLLTEISQNGSATFSPRGVSVASTPVRTKMTAPNDSAVVSPPRMVNVMRTTPQALRMAAPETEGSATDLHGVARSCTARAMPMACESLCGDFETLWGPGGAPSLIWKTFLGIAAFRAAELSQRKAA